MRRRPGHRLPILAGYAAQAPYKGKFKLAGLALSDERYGIGLPGGSTRKGRVQSALAAMVADGSWARAVRKNLPLLSPDPNSLQS
ncbi:hypothetical protein [Streptomyces sp. NPDC002676]